MRSARGWNGRRFITVRHIAARGPHGPAQSAKLKHLRHIAPNQNETTDRSGARPPPSNEAAAVQRLFELRRLRRRLRLIAAAGRILDALDRLEAERTARPPAPSAAFCRRNRDRAGYLAARDSPVRDRRTTRQPSVLRIGLDLLVPLARRRGARSRSTSASNAARGSRRWPLRFLWTVRTAETVVSIGFIGSRIACENVLVGFIESARNDPMFHQSLVDRSLAKTTPLRGGESSPRKPPEIHVVFDDANDTVDTVAKCFREGVLSPSRVSFLASAEPKCHPR